MSKYPTPDYQVLKKDNRFELRHYDVFYTVSAPEKTLSGKNAFGLLFSYIKGKNNENQKLSMTVPVINNLKQEMSLEFVIPKEHYNDIPVPTNKELSITKHEAKDVAVYRFPGFSSEKKIDKVQKRLLTWIHKQNLKPKGEIILARYNPPIVPPFFRKNELMIEIEN